MRIATETGSVIDPPHRSRQAGAGASSFAAELAGASQDFLARIEAAQPAYQAVVDKAQQSGGMNDPRGFLKGLNASELQALQHMHGLADPIQPAGLSHEAALNLLLPRGQARDLDGDGLTQVGAAHLIVFPPADAPAAFREAWRQGMQGVDPGLRLDMQLQMWQHSRLDAAPADRTDYRVVLDRVIAANEFNLPQQQTPAQKAHVQSLLNAYRQLREHLA